MAVDRNKLTSFAASKLGMNYVWGGTSDSGYDCSGLIYQAYQNQGVSIPRVAQDQYNASTKVSRDKLRPGDSVFFSDTGSTSNVTHTGMYIGDGKYIHAASSSKGIIVSDLPTGGSYFVGGGSLAGSGGSSGGYNSGNLSAALGSISGGSSVGSTMSDNLLAALNAGNTYQPGSSGFVENIQNSFDTSIYSQITGEMSSATGVSFKDKILIIIGHIVKVLTLVLVFALAAILFMKAFDIKRPSIGGVI